MKPGRSLSMAGFTAAINVDNVARYRVSYNLEGQRFKPEELKETEDL